MSKFRAKFGKRLMAYVLTGVMIVSNMTSSNLTAFASTPTDEEEYQIETSSAIEETSDEEEKMVEEKNVEVENAETTDSGTTPPQQSDVNQSDVNQSDVDQSDVDQSDVDQSDVDQSDVDQSDVEEADADGFYDGFKAAKAVEGRPYYFNFETEYAEVSSIENIHEKGLFSFNAGNTSAAVYNGGGHGVEFKTNNKLTFKVAGNSYIVVGGNNSSNCTDLAAASTSGTLKPTTLSTQTGGRATLANCKEKGANTLIYEYTGTAGAVDLTLNLSEGQTSTKAYIAYVCVIPKASVSEEPDTTHTSWNFSASEFQTTANQAGVSEYKGLKATNAKAHNGKYLYIGSNGTLLIPVAGDSTVTVKAQYGNKFYFADNSEDVKEGSGEAISEYTYEYTGKKGYVKITSLATTYLTEITVEAAPDTTYTSWNFSASDFQTEANKTSVSEYKGLKATNAKAHNGKYLYIGSN
ncbi:MAG: hypothetical protein K2N89_12325, partial [Lachnospiraceae bacterium]|nr:hypothetical protein [Lachnospiraceae bacterium]